MFIITNRVSAINLHLLWSLFIINVTNEDVRKRSVIYRIFGIRKKTADLSQMLHRRNLNK